MYIHQKQLENLKNLVIPGKVTVIYGPRRCGKTTLITKFLKSVKEPYLSLTGEDITVQQELSCQSIERLKSFIGDHSLLVIDEAQKIPSIGINLKLIVDHIPRIKVIATGSSAFDIARHTGEPLTGRQYTLRLYPLAQMEIQQIENRAQTLARLPERLIYGSYPEIVLLQANRQRERYLREIVNAYLYKDILELEGIRHSETILRLVQLLAFQIGKDVSLTELGQQLGMSKNTVDRYLDILQKAFVIFGVSGFSRNLRKEISKSRRYYFYDTGIRNAVIQNFNPLELRNDVGQLWENYCILERIKRQEYLEFNTQNYFWRTYTQQEIDWVEEGAGELHGYEFKWGFKKPKAPREWVKNYPSATFDVISKENYLSFIL